MLAVLGPTNHMHLRACGSRGKKANILCNKMSQYVFPEQQCGRVLASFLKHLWHLRTRGVCPHHAIDATQTCVLVFFRSAAFAIHDSTCVRRNADFDANAGIQATKLQVCILLCLDVCAHVCVCTMLTLRVYVYSLVYISKACATGIPLNGQACAHVCMNTV